MKRIVLLLPFLLSMGEPVKEGKLKFVVEDKEGIRHNLSSLACDGRTYIRVKEGNLEYSIDFSSLDKVEVLTQRDKDLKLKLYLKNGGSKEYIVSPNTYCKGKSQMGQASFYLRDVKFIFISTEEK